MSRKLPLPWPLSAVCYAANTAQLHTNVSANPGLESCRNSFRDQRSFAAGSKLVGKRLDRTQPGLPMKKGRAGTITHDYKRHGGHKLLKNIFQSG
jgi:hypothetical protein